MQASFIRSSDAGLFAESEFWDRCAYSIAPRRFLFTLASLELAPGVQISQTFVHGHLRARSAYRGDGVHVELAEIRSQRAYLQAAGAVRSATVVTTAGCLLDRLSSDWAQSISIRLDAARTAAILDDGLRAKLGARIVGRSGRRALVAGVTRAGYQLRRRIKEILAHVEAEASAVAPSCGAHVLDLGVDASEVFAGYGDALVEMTRNVIDEAASGVLAPVARLAPARVELARQIEALLWRAPSLDRDRDLSLCEIARRFKTSRRTVQCALQEYFGLGYVAYRRVVRLHQLRRAIESQRGRASLTRLGHDFHFTHFGRLAADYRALFGRLPSDDLREEHRDAAATSEAQRLGSRPQGEPEPGRSRQGP